MLISNAMNNRVRLTLIGGLFVALLSGCDKKEEIISPAAPNTPNNPAMSALQALAGNPALNRFILQWMKK